MKVVHFTGQKANTNKSSENEKRKIDSSEKTDDLDSIDSIEDVEEVKEVDSEESNLERSPKKDTIDFSHKKPLKGTVSMEEKNDIMHKAKGTASGWTIFGGLLSTLYFAARSDKTVAKKYDLNEKKDKNFIKEIKKNQTIATLPGALHITSIIPWVYFRFFEDPQDQLLLKPKQK